MKVAICQFFGFHPPHLAVEMELAESHVQAGDHVTVLSCAGNLLSCDENIDHEWVLCQRCRYYRASGMNSAGPGRVLRKPFPLPTRSERDRLFSLPYAFATVAELRAVKLEGFDIGEAVLSSIVSRYRNPEVDVVLDRQLIRRQLISAGAVYLAMRRYLGGGDVDRAYVFNGRYACMRAIFRACRESGVTCYTHDRGCDLAHYELYENRLPHEIEPTVAEIRAAWEKAPPGAREQAGAEFFEQRARGVVRNWHDFTADQDEGRLPDEWKENRHNVAVFISSEDEFACVGDEWRNPAYPNQAAALRLILDELAANGNPAGVHLTIRMHPNLRGLSNTSTRALSAMTTPCSTVVMPENPVSSYALLRRASSVLTFGSTMGIEALYWGQPTILCGPSYYRDLGGGYVATSHREVMQLIQRDLEPQDRLPALMYGYYMNTFGTRYRSYVPSGLFEGSYRTHRMVIMNEPRWCFRLVERWPRLRRMLNRLWLMKAKIGLSGRLRWLPDQGGGVITDRRGAAPCGST